MAESKLEAARRKGDLAAAIGALREEARAEMANVGMPVREQVGLEDASIRVATGLAGKSDVERRAALRDLRPGSTVTPQGVEKATSPGEPRGPLKEIYDFSQYDDDEIGLIDPATLTEASSDAYVEELDQRMAGAGSYAEAQAWQIEEADDDSEADYESLFETAWLGR
jgi:hypothetical protein